MRSRFAILFCCLTVVLSQAQSTKPQSASVAEKLAGAWRLVSIETIGPHGEVTYPYYGKHPEGLLIYDRSGWMSVQAVADPKPTVPKSASREEQLAAPLTEKAAAIDGYYAYCGTWTVDPKAETVTHHIQQSLFPGERGQNGVRQFSLDGDRLTLTARVHEMGKIISGV